MCTCNDAMPGHNVAMALRSQSTLLLLFDVGEMYVVIHLFLILLLLHICYTPAVDIHDGEPSAVVPRKGFTMDDGR